MEKVTKEVQILKSLTTRDYFDKVEQLFEAKNEYFVLNEDSVCSKCNKKIGNYPFFYMPKTKELIHLYELE